MTKLSNIDLEKVTGGVFTPCARLDNLTLGELRAEGRDAALKDLSQAQVSCGTKLPHTTKKSLDDARHILF